MVQSKGSHDTHLLAGHSPHRRKYRVKAGRARIERRARQSLHPPRSVAAFCDSRPLVLVGVSIAHKHRILQRQALSAAKTRCYRYLALKEQGWSLSVDLSGRRIIKIKKDLLLTYTKLRKKLPGF